MTPQQIDCPPRSVANFVQALRRKRYLYGQNAQCDTDQFIDVVCNLSSSFPIDEITDCGENDDGRKQISIEQRLTGRAGTLPRYWQDYIKSSRSEGGDVLHAIVAALQAIVLHIEDVRQQSAQPWIQREWTTCCAEVLHDSLSEMVMQLLGPELREAAIQCQIPLEWIVRNAGLFLVPPTHEGLGVLLRQTTRLPINISVPRNCKQPRVRLKIGPVTRMEFDSLRPAKQRLQRLLHLTHLYCGDGCRVDVEISLRAEDVRPIMLDCSHPSWDSWGVTPGSQTRAATVQLTSWDCQRLVEACV